ncbi:MAG: LL-diaminopimelate aminotransferase, partial [Clostridia bacterium]|nr:LL-diaminopimelate aminotransferase [Clostridia bacterium]
MNFSRRLDRFEDEIFAALNDRKVELEAQGRTLYNLSVGTPDFEPAPHIRKALTDAAADPKNWGYSLRDIPELLDAVAAYYQRRFGVSIGPENICSCY